MQRRRVLITGAGSGLGRALAERHAARGDRVACVDIDAARADETCGRLVGDGHLAVQADVGDDASMQALHQTIERRWGGPLDRLFNNAGVASGGAMVDTTMDEWQRVLEINLLGVVRGCRLFLPAMLEAGRGHVINTASFAGLAGAPSIMSYGVSKAAVVALSEQLRAECAGRSVQVSVLCPAFFQTGLLANWHGDGRLRRFAEKMMADSPDSLDEVADACVAAIDRGRFLVLPTRREPLRWRLKRWLPEVYFGRLLKLAAARAAAR